MHLVWHLSFVSKYRKPQLTFGILILGVPNDKTSQLAGLYIYGFVKFVTSPGIRSTEYERFNFTARFDIPNR